MTQRNEEIVEEVIGRLDPSEQVHFDFTALGYRVLEALETKDTEHKNWLRSEIEKLESAMKVVKICDDQQSYPMCSNCEGGYSECLWAREDNIHNQALTSIITRYKEELKVLESK